MMRYKSQEVLKFLRNVIQKEVVGGSPDTRRLKQIKFYHLRYVENNIGRFGTILSLLPDGKNLKVLDVGAGGGFISIILKDKLGFDVDATDLNRNVFLFGENFEKNGILYQPCDLTREQLPYPSEYYDVVIFSEVLEHLYCNPLKPLSEIARCLKEKGYLIITTPNVASLENIGKLILGNNILPPTNNSWLHASTATPHVRMYTVNEIRSLLNEVGLEVASLRMEMMYRLEVDRPISGLIWIITKLLRRFRYTIIIRAKKCASTQKAVIL